MLVHRGRASAHVIERVDTQTKRDGQADRRPKRVTSTYPVPKLKNTVVVDAEIASRLRVGRHGGKVVERVSDAIGTQPVDRASSIGQ
jgi:hypothetical protein